MGEESTPKESKVISRRLFIAGGLAGLASLQSQRGYAQTELVPTQPARASDRRNPNVGPARVVIAADPVIVPSRVVQISILRDTLDRMLATFAGTQSASEAWNKILRADDRILLKFNQSAAPLMGTNPAMATAIVDSLVTAGFSPEKICVLESVPELPRGRALREPDYRWQGEAVDFGAVGNDVFSANLDWATAVINVPFLKTHHMAVMTGCLKNLSHGLIRHPARFHGRRCQPAVAAINATDHLRNKLKLNIINGLRVNFDRGPEASEREIASAGWIAMTKDPVAGDRVGFAYINQVRAKRGLSPLLPSPQIPLALSAAGRFGVGESGIERIAQLGLD